MTRVKHHRPCQDGYVLFDLMLAMVLIAILAAVSMPGFRRSVGTGLLRASAIETMSLLRSDRTSAVRAGRAVTTSVDREGDVVRSGISRDAVRLPEGVRAIPAAIRFLPDGHASGGPLLLQSDAARIAILVDTTTGVVDARAE